MSGSPRRGEIWSTGTGTGTGASVLVISSTVYNEIRAEPTVVVVPVFDNEPDAGFGVGLRDGWAAPGLDTSLRKTRLDQPRRSGGVQTLADVNNMLLMILATPDR